MRKHQAIRILYPNVLTVYQTEENGFVASDENGDNVSLDMSAIDTKAEEILQAEQDEKTAKANAKISGNTKLLDLGLTQAEATALTGYTPE